MPWRGLFCLCRNILFYHLYLEIIFQFILRYHHGKIVVAHATVDGINGIGSFVSIVFAKLKKFVLLFAFDLCTN